MTWECPQRITKHKDSKSGEIRLNPYRNQIDYIMVKNRININIADSRSHGGMSAKSDHKPVITQIEIKWPLEKSKKFNKNINFALLHDQTHKKEYQIAVTKHLGSQSEIKSNQDRWTNIVNATKKAAIESLGISNRLKNNKSPGVDEIVI